MAAAMGDSTDGRIQWVCGIVCKGLELPLESFTAQLHSAVHTGSPSPSEPEDDAASGPTLEDLLLRFFHHRTPIDSTLLFFLDPNAADDARALCCALNKPSEMPQSGRMGARQVYLTKVVDGDVTNCSESRQIEFGVLTGNALEDLSELLREIYLPVLSSASRPAVGAGVVEDGEAEVAHEELRRDSMGDADLKEHGKQFGLEREIRSGMQKFESQIQNALQQVNGEVHLSIPNVAVVDVDATAEDYDTVCLLEDALESWTKSVATIVEQEGRRIPVGRGPLAEIEFWRKRNASLSCLYEQINLESVQQMLKVLEKIEATLLPNFKYHFTELNKLYVEARDNVKFLTTLERHLKNISGHGCSLSSILDTLPSMMNSIRMVWIISRHYNTDERMVPLMERIALEIADKVAAEVNIQTILRKDPVVALRTVDEAISVLESWYKTYMHVREKIEVSGTDHRWEFDRKKLFEQTNYMAKICENLHEIATVLDQFQKFLGPELKAVTGDSEGIDAVVLLVEGLIEPFEAVVFDVFDRRFKNSWDELVEQFRGKVEDIEAMTKTFIDTSFQKLRSAEGAFELLQNFQTIQSRDSINKQMMQKFDDILLQYSKELERIAAIFESNRDHPPVFKNYPPVAGAIAWAQHLYYRSKRPIMKFKTMESVFGDSKAWQVVVKQYTDLARNIKQYKTDKFSRWEANAYPTSLLLQQPIFGPPLVEIPIKGSSEVRRVLPPLPFHVNFSSSLVQLIRETKYLDRMGYKVPEAALNVALQEDKYHGFVRALQQTLSNYNAVLSTLSGVERRLVSGRLEEVQNAIMQGFDPCNWCSLHINTLIERCNKAINEFQSVVSQIHKSSTMIQDVVTSIERCQLVELADFVEHLHKSGRSQAEAGRASLPQDGTMQVSSLYEKLERRRSRRLNQAVRKYKSIGPLLVKIEEIIAFTNTGASPVLAEYYAYWERKIYNAITKMILSGMGTLQVLLNLDESNKEEAPPELQVEGLAYKAVRKAPLCKLNATLNGNHVVVSPTLPEVSKYLSKCVKNQVESSKSFVRWMRGTCKECPAQVVKEDEEPLVYSFYYDISKNPQVIKMTLGLSHAFQRGFAIVERYLESWQRYDQLYGLWDTKKKDQLARLADKDKACVFFDTRIGLYERLAQAVKEQLTWKDIDFLRIDCYSVSIGIAAKAREWQQEYGKILCAQSSVKLQSILSEMQELRDGISREPEDLDELKAVLNDITAIDEMKMQKELDINETMECFRTLEKSGLDATSLVSADREEDSGQFDAKELSQAFSSARVLNKTWHTLWIDSKTKDLRLNRVKDKFRIVTQEDAEKFSSQVQEVKRNFDQTGPGSLGADMDLQQGAASLKDYKQQLSKLFARREEIVNAQKLFNLELSSYPALVQMKSEIAQLDILYGFFEELSEFETKMSSMLWTELDVEALLKGAEGIEKKVRRCNKELRKISVFDAVEECVVRFKNSIPLLQMLKNDSMKPRHWETLSKVTGVKFEMDPKTFTLGALFEMKLSRFESEISEIVNEAMQETKIEKSLKDIEEKWRSTDFALAKYKKGSVDKGYVLRAAEEIKLELEDNMLNLQTMSASRFVVSFTDVVRDWEKKLNHVSETIDIWFKVQSKWMYLESIFIGAEDIRMQLPQEAKKFDQVDKAWKGVMTNTSKNANVIEACHAENRIETLRTLSDRLDLCQKSLSDYLDTKRNAFPRFFFISDDELLSVLGSSDPTSIQVHMLKLFDNCKDLSFTRSAKGVNGMGSSEGEKFAFREVAEVDGAVEGWMTCVESEMRSTLRLISKEGVFHYATEERVKWVDLFIGMVGVLGSQIWWTWEVEDVFRQVRNGHKHAMKNLEEKLTGQLNDLVAVVRQDISKHMRKKVNTLLIIDVHARDIVDTFVRDSILDEREFAWESQLRFYWDKSVDDVVIRQCTGSFSYGYEFMGLNGRLVITPLTDRCYMTITQAHTFNLGTAPAGPAGTGKTETVKDLAKGMALPCFVINCGEGLDYKAMGSIFSGLAQIGAWGCFDEFNRINIEVLSVVSAQLQAIQGGLKSGRKSVDIGLGMEIRLDPKIGIFVTMNPGYAGRTELPDNLKALFRPVTMIKPDLLQICEIMLFSEGFETAKVLAKKMTTLYSLAQGQLSKQYHYDFGLRALKSVLVMAGGLKRQYSEMSEDLVLMRALRDANMPKFVFDDVPLFRGLIADLFPKLDCPRVAFEALKKQIEDTLSAGHYRPADDVTFQLQVDKVIQMYETMLTRHTCMIVGPTGGGKTVVLETLQTAQGASFNEVIKMLILNPKAQTLAELYGELDPVTRDWTDGVLSNLFRGMNEPLPAGRENEIRWLIFDGDVDALWIENMNSVMDDNRLLTLPNGERIRLQPYCKLIMETFDLQYASPATISRCGMVYVDPKNIGYRPYFERWLKQRTPSSATGSEEEALEALEHEREILVDLFDRFVPPLIGFIFEGTVGEDVVERPTTTIPITDLSMVKQMCTLLDALLLLHGSGENLLTDADVEGLFIFAVTWSLGAAMVASSRGSFHEVVASCATTSLPESLYDSFYDVESHRWEDWAGRVPAYEQPVPFEFAKIMVPTKENVLYTHILSLVNSVRKPLLFVGDPGTAKTVTIQAFLNKSSDMKLNINFSSRTTSLDVQNNIVDNVDKRSGKVYGPPAGKQLLVFIDDMNMPIVDTYGTQAPIALLHFLVGKGSMYDRGKELDLRYYKDLQFLAAMGPPGGGRNKTDPRFIALFNVFNLTPPSEAVLVHIYDSIISAYFAEAFDDSVKAVCAKITAATLGLYSKLLATMPPTPSKFHYVFNLRDLGRVYEGLCLATPDCFDGKGGKVVRLWRNECTRVLFDRLIDEQDNGTAQGYLQEIIKASFNEFCDEVSQEPLLFGDFSLAAQRIAEGGEDPMLYDNIDGYDSVRKVFDEILEFYNVDNKPMTLVLFEQAVEHLCRIYRVIRFPLGHALLVGVGGSGKQSLTRLATFAAGYGMFEITLSRGYMEKEFREDLKELYKRLVTGPVVFLFTDAHVVEEGFLELINNMLTTGMVPALLENDEKDQMCNAVRADAKAQGIVDTKENLWAFYTKRCKENLHIILAMSPSGDTLRVRCRNFPGLVSGCVIDWFFPWPADALRNVANYFLQDEALPDAHRESIVEHMVLVHQGVMDASADFFIELRRHNYVTPKNYLDYISNYRAQMKEKRKRTQDSIKRLGGGLTKLNEAEISVDKMSKELSEKKVVVDAKTKDCQAMIADIDQKQKVAGEKQAAAEQKKQELEEKNEIIEVEKGKADEQLQDAIPALEAAALALENLNKKDITEIKAFANPPRAVMSVMMCIVHLKPTGKFVSFLGL